MKNLAEQIVNIISDYERPDNETMNADHVLTWVKQFDVNDRQFLLEELIHILPKSYISYEAAKEYLIDALETIRESYNELNIPDLLNNTSFLSCQAEYKSQSELLRMLNEITIGEYNVDIFQPKPITKYCFYIDDVLASGGTLKKDFDKLKENHKLPNDMIIICLFFFLHSWGLSNKKYTMSNDYGEDFVNNIKWWRFYTIENNPKINLFNPNPTFNHVYPIKDDSQPEHENYLDSLIWANSNEDYAYRDPNLPIVENFYSSKENRIRYEHIILNKGIEIINRINTPKKNERPLGITLPSYKTFGLGSHTFTWRNISNTCPLVFWWGFNDWFPLFPVKNRGNN